MSNLKKVISLLLCLSMLVSIDDLIYCDRTSVLCKSQ